MVTLKEYNRVHIGLLVSFLAIFIWSGINPKDMFTWVLEVFPAIIGLFIIFASYNRFRLTTFTYCLIWVHGIILVIGGHYTYAEMPLFNWLKDTFDLQRNYYDRLGHLAQGFVPAIIAREILLRKTPLKNGKMLYFLVVCVCLAISASYELLEWSMAEMTGTAADAFLGTQGDVWDSQKDMLMAIIGANVALMGFSSYHDRLLVKEVLPKIAHE